MQVREPKHTAVMKTDGHQQAEQPERKNIMEEKKKLSIEELQSAAGGWTEEQLTEEERDEYRRYRDAVEYSEGSDPSAIECLEDFIYEMDQKYGTKWLQFAGTGKERWAQGSRRDRRSSRKHEINRETAGQMNC